MSQTTVNIEPDLLKARYRQIKQEQPSSRIRNIARELGVSEGELVALSVGETVTRLVDNPQEILKAVHRLGEVMALTRNEDCIHERKGVYDNAQFYEHEQMKQGLFVNPDIDLRLFMSQWHFCFAVCEETRSGTRRSLQFFDKAGEAIHKIYVTTKSNEDEYDVLVKEFTAATQEDHIDVEAYEPKPEDRPDAEVDWKGFREAWLKLKDTHDFYPMLKKFKVGREQALRHIGSDLAYQVDNTASRDMLQMARDKQCEIMVFVGNRGCIQIHTGPVSKLVKHEHWYNVLDPMFNLHLNEDGGIAHSWITKKPTEDGTVTALEIFDHNGELIVTFFGKRKPGIPELELWREIIDAIPARKKIHAA